MRNAIVKELKILDKIFAFFDICILLKYSRLLLFKIAYFENYKIKISIPLNDCKLQ